MDDEYPALAARHVMNMARAMQAELNRMGAGTMIDDQVDASIEPETDEAAYHEYLSEGVQVMYVMRNGERRPAIVVRAWKIGGTPDMVNLCVFLDGSNDSGNLPPGGLLKGDGMLYWATSVHYDTGSRTHGYTPHTWQYMDEDEDIPEDEAEAIIAEQEAADPADSIA